MRFFYRYNTPFALHRQTDGEWSVHCHQAKYLAPLEETFATIQSLDMEDFCLFSEFSAKSASEDESKDLPEAGSYQIWLPGIPANNYFSDNTG